MTELPFRRLAVYVVAGLVVLGVGIWGLVTMRHEAGGSETRTVIEDPGASKETTSSGAGVSTTLRQIYVQVLGEVRRPGVYALPLGSRVFEAVKVAGGLTERADEQNVLLAALVADGGRIVVPARGQAPTPGSSSPPSTEVAAGLGGKGGPGSGAPVSLSTATAEELDGLPGVGPAIAQRIISFREANGGFTSVDQLEEVPGIGPATLTRLRGLIIP
jgi:competence protein ComEA